jgi:hypothetical protein
MAEGRVTHVTPEAAPTLPFDELRAPRATPRGEGSAYRGGAVGRQAAVSRRPSAVGRQPV